MRPATSPPQINQPEVGRKGDQIDAHTGISDMHLPLNQRQGDARERRKCFLSLTFLAWITEFKQSRGAQQ